MDQFTHGLPTDPSKRIICIVDIEVIDSNPNGNPYLGGAPRVNDRGFGVITRGCYGRKIRDYVTELAGEQMFHAHGADLSAVQENFRPKGSDKVNVDGDGGMLASLWDLGLFGGTLVAAGARKVRGAAKLSNGVSLDPVEVDAVPFTAAPGYEKTKTTAKKKAEKAKKGKNAATDTDIDDDIGDDTEDEKYLSTAFNEYHLVRYGVYRFTMTFDPSDAAKNRLTPRHLALLWEGMINGWEASRSAHRTTVNVRRIYAFETDSPRGREPEHVTLARIRTKLLPDVDGPTKFEDYETEINLSNMPAGMKLYRWEDGPVTEIETITSGSTVNSAREVAQAK